MSSDQRDQRDQERDEKWEARGIALSLTVAGFSSCIRDKVGAVVIDPVSWDIISIGFNDTAPGLPNCIDGGCPRALKTIPPDTPMTAEEECLHAEDNALQRAGIRARGAWLVSSRATCPQCARRAKTAGIARTIHP